MHPTRGYGRASNYLFLEDTSLLKRILLVLSIFAASSSLHAQNVLPRGDVFLGYSYTHLDFGQGFTRNANGYEFSAAGQVIPFLSIVGDYSGHYGTGGLHEQNFLVGPRVSVELHKVMPFAQILFGVAHYGSTAASDTSFATGIGGGLDYHLTGPVAWRNEVDYLRTGFFNTTQNDVRISTGLSLRF